MPCGRYLSEFETQPGGPHGRSATMAGQQPISPATSPEVVSPVRAESKQSPHPPPGGESKAQRQLKSKGRYCAPRG